MEDERTYTAFSGTRRIASGDLRATLLQAKAAFDAGPAESLLIFEDQTGQQVDFDFTGTPDEVVERAAPSRARAGPGRPKLGVVSREVSLLPRHWEWLEQQPQGSSAAIRRLVDEARKREPGKERARRAIEAAAKFMWVMAGNLPNFEEASRALYTKDWPRLEQLIGGWPEDIRAHVQRVAGDAARFEAEAS